MDIVEEVAWHRQRWVIVCMSACTATFVGEDMVKKQTHTHPQLDSTLECNPPGTPSARWS